MNKKQKKKQDLNHWYNNWLPRWYKSHKRFCYISGVAFIFWGIILSIMDINNNGFSSDTIIIIVVSIAVGTFIIFDFAKRPLITLILGDISKDMEEKLLEQKKIKQQNNLKSKNKKQ